MTNKPHDNESRGHQNAPVYWFALMEIARERGNFEQAAEAKRELQRLGVRVSYERPQGVAHG